MKADIVQRLRDWSATICMVRGMGGDVPASKARMALEAADEIERTRAERDAARRELCMIVAGKGGKSAFVSNDAVEIARERQWDCFRENP